MSHAFYILASYAITAVTILSLVLWTWSDGRARRRELAALEAAGLRRRSAAPATASQPSPGRPSSPATDPSETAAP